MSIDSKTSKKSTITGNKALSHYFDNFELLLIDENSYLLYMTTYSELILNPLAKKFQFACFF